MNVVNVPGNYLHFARHRTCLKIDIVEMLKCSKKVRCQKLPEEKQSFQEVSCFLAEVLGSEDLAVRQMLYLQIGISKQALVSRNWREFGERLWGKREIGCAVQGNSPYCAHHVGDNLLQL